MFPRLSETPAFVFNRSEIISGIAALKTGLAKRDVQILYSVKACAVFPILEIISGLVDGFSIASANEGELVSRLDRPRQIVQMTSPAITERSIRDLETATHITFNSISQIERLAANVPSTIAVGARVRPTRSTVDDVRFDSSRPSSKLGTRMSLMAKWLRASKTRVSGLHFHTGCLNTSWTSVRETVAEIVETFGSSLHRLRWINLGGGHIWDDLTEFGPLLEAVDLLKQVYGLQVFIEPGAGIVNSAGSLVSSVVDVFESDDKRVAVLDTTVNHLPEVFEYQFEPDIAEHEVGGPYEYLLAGCSCLAGDIFGLYTFQKPLEIGSRITFKSVGAYTLVKAHTFNGISLPSIYILDERGEPALIQEFTFDDFAARCGADIYKDAHI